MRSNLSGWPPDYVADRLNQALGGGTVYSDAPDFDAAWLRTLFQAVGQPPTFAIEQVDDLLIAIMRALHEAVWQVVVRLAELKRQIAAVSAGKHDAGYDVGYLLQLWRAAGGHAVKMNHGIGPLPATSPTGTFLRLKRDGAGGTPGSPR